MYKLVIAYGFGRLEKMPFGLRNCYNEFKIFSIVFESIDIVQQNSSFKMISKLCCATV